MGILDFKTRGWPNGGKNQNRRNSLDQKLTPKKSHTELRTTKIIQLKSSQLRKYLPNFSYSKRIPEFKILNPKNPSDHRRHLKSGVPPLEFRSTPNFLIESFAYDVLHNRKTDCQIRSWVEETYK